MQFASAPLGEREDDVYRRQAGSHDEHVIVGRKTFECPRRPGVRNDQRSTDTERGEDPWLWRTQSQDGATGRPDMSGLCAQEQGTTIDVPLKGDVHDTFTNPRNRRPAGSLILGAAQDILEIDAVQVTRDEVVGTKRATEGTKPAHKVIRNVFECTHHPRRCIEDVLRIIRGESRTTAQFRSGINEEDPNRFQAAAREVHCRQDATRSSTDDGDRLRGTYRKNSHGISLFLVFP